MEYLIGSAVTLIFVWIWKGGNKTKEEETLDIVKRIERILRVVQKRHNINNTEQEYING